MGGIHYSKRFEASPDRVFEALTNVERWPDVISGITSVKKITDGPVGVGTRFVETRSMFGKDRSEEMEFTAFEPGKSFTIGCQSCGCDMSFVHRLTPDGSGTRFELDSETRPMNLLAKLTVPLMGAMMKKSMLKCMDQDYRDIAAHLDDTAQPATA